MASDSLEGLSGELGRLRSRQRELAAGCAGRLAALDAALAAARTGADADGDLAMGGGGEAVRAAVRALQDGFAAELKAVVGTMSRFSKLVDTVGGGGGGEGGGAVGKGVVLEAGGMGRAVAGHLFRTGAFEVGRVFCEEAGVDVEEEREVRPFEVLHALVGGFREGQLDGCVKWAAEARARAEVEAGEGKGGDGGGGDEGEGEGDGAGDVRMEEDGHGGAVGESGMRGDAAAADATLMLPASSSESDLDSSDSDSDEDENGGGGGAVGAVDANTGAKEDEAAAANGVGGGAAAKAAAAAPPGPVAAAARLEFALRSLQYLDLLQAGDRTGALRYARASLALFVPLFLDEVQALMACLLYAPRLATSPYAALVARDRRAAVERALAAEYCRVAGVAPESPLLSLARCGAAALPVLAKAARVSPNWRDLGVDDTLPVEIEVGRDCMHHSVFTCPVSREEATDENGPMLLTCGHVLSRQTVVRLPRANNPRFKCPYCPMEQLPAECKPLTF